MSSSYTQLGKYTGTRFDKSEDIKNLCDSWDLLPLRDAMITSVALFSHRAQATTPKRALAGSHFHMISAVDQRTFHKLDDVIFNQYPDLSFIEISPVQPLGLNSAIAHLSQSRILSTVRSSEVNADITTALFRHAYTTYAQNPVDTAKVGGMARIVRAQSYNPKTKFLPHFRMFGHVTVARNGKRYQTTAPGHLLRHISEDMDLMQAIKDIPDSLMKHVELELGETRFMNELIRRKLVDGDEIRRHTTDPEYDVFKRFNIKLPETLKLDDPQLYDILREYKLDDAAADLNKFFSELSKSRPDIADVTYIRLNRIADIGYYEGICFNIYATNKTGLRLPAANGGYTDWSASIHGRKDELCIISGIGEELLARYYFIDQPKELA